MNDESSDDGIPPAAIFKIHGKKKPTLVVGQHEAPKVKARKKRIAKRKPRATLKRFFKPTLNFQGINEAICRNVKGEDRGKVYVPEEYGHRHWAWRHELAIGLQKYCGECQLQPCCMVEYKDKIEEETRRLKGFGWYSRLKIRQTVAGYTMAWIGPHFPSAYWKKAKKNVPPCITRKLSIALPNCQEEQSEDDSSGEEFEYE